MTQEAAYWIAILFSAAFGGSIGSFLNVVVYRLPNGLSLVSPPSHCPKCKEPIRWYDNVPVFGWLMLGGKCRNCRCWIPIRYPAIEALTAAMFVGLAIAEHPLQAYPWHLVSMGYHALLFCTLLCSALIEIDGNRPPLSLFVPAIVIGIAAPFVMPIPHLGLTARSVAPAAAPLDVLAGLAAGAAAGGIAWLLARGRQILRTKDAADAAPLSLAVPLGLFCTGLFLGWFAVVVVGAAVLVIHGAMLFPGRGKMVVLVPPGVWVLVGAATWLLA